MMDDGFRRRRSAVHMANRDAAYADASERVRIQASLAEKLLGALLIAHGGGIIGLFTFTGNLMGREKAPLHLDVTMIWVAFGLFALGLGTCLVAYLFAFMSQDAYYRQAIAEVERLDRSIFTEVPQIDQSAEIKHNERGNAHFAYGLFVAGASIVLFVGGSMSALAGLLPG